MLSGKNDRHEISAKKTVSLPKIKVNLLQLGVEFGIMIALPLIVLILIGLYLDKKFQTIPLFIISGVILALIISSIALYKKITAIFQEFDQK